ncbi:hypothetical protein ACTXT7_014715 [Hymenolepis weldensis]
MSVRDEFDVINAFVKQLEEMSLLRKIRGTGSMIMFRILPKGQFKIEVDNSYPQSLPKWQVVFEEEVVNSPDTPFPVEATTIIQAFICAKFKPISLKARRLQSRGQKFARLLKLRAVSVFSTPSGETTDAGTRVTIFLTFTVSKVAFRVVVLLYARTINIP